METTQENVTETQTQTDSFWQDHPWLEVDGEVDEDIRYSLDELRLV